MPTGVDQIARFNRFFMQSAVAVLELRINLLQRIRWRRQLRLIDVAITISLGFAGHVLIGILFLCQQEINADKLQM